MSYGTPQALRTALEARVRNESAATGVPPDRLRRRVVFQRIVTRLQRAEPGRWVLKGGMAIEVRLRDAARLTKDLDLGLRESGTASSGGLTRCGQVVMPIGTTGGWSIVSGGGTGSVPGTARVVRKTQSIRWSGRAADGETSAFPDRLKRRPLRPPGLRLR